MFFKILTIVLQLPKFTKPKNLYLILLAAVCGHRIGGAGGAGQMVRLVGLVTRTI